MKGKMRLIHSLKRVTVLIPLGMLLSMQAAEAGRYVTDPQEGIVVNGFKECWGAAGGMEMADAKCGDQIMAEPDPDIADADGDGVPDDKDKCPGTPAGVQVDADGCPLDSDGDGVPDYLDKCFGTRSGVSVDKDGCEIVGNLTIDLTNEEFDSNSAALKPEMKTALADLASKIKASTGNEVLTVIGHTDSMGSDAYNQKLSVRRAQATADYLSSQGIGNIRVEGRGESQPIADNGTAEGRNQNRRVEVHTK